MSHPLSSERRSGVWSRSGPATAVIGIHFLIAYVLSVSMGVIRAPEIVQQSIVRLVPETRPVEPEPIPPKQPIIENPRDPITTPLPAIPLVEPVVPVAEVPMPPSQNAIAATQAAEPPAQAAPQNMKVSRRVEPAYPPSARRAGEEGTVQLRILVDERGMPGEVQVLKGSGFPRLDQAAVDAVRRWRFIAATNGSQAIAAWTQVAITFRLTDGNS